MGDSNEVPSELQPAPPSPYNFQDFLDAIHTQTALLRSEYSRSYTDHAESELNPSATILDLTNSPAVKTQNPVRILYVVAYVGTGLGLLELGTVVIPINTTILPVVFDCRIQLSANDRRTLSSVSMNAGVPGARGSGNATFLSLALFGEEIPRAGMQWS